MATRQQDGHQDFFLKWLPGHTLVRVKMAARFWCGQHGRQESRWLPGVMKSWRKQDGHCVSESARGQDGRQVSESRWLPKAKWLPGSGSYSRWPPCHVISRTKWTLINKMAASTQMLQRAKMAARSENRHVKQDGCHRITVKMAATNDVIRFKMATSCDVTKSKMAAGNDVNTFKMASSCDVNTFKMAACNDATTFKMAARCEVTVPNMNPHFKMTSSR